jgi:hypothetical protein
MSYSIHHSLGNISTDRSSDHVRVASFTSFASFASTRPAQHRIKSNHLRAMTPNTPVSKVISALTEYVIITALSKILWWMHIPNRYSLATFKVCVRYKLTVLLPCDDCCWCIDCINEQFNTVNHNGSL